MLEGRVGWRMLEAVYHEHVAIMSSKIFKPQITWPKYSELKMSITLFF